MIVASKPCNKQKGLYEKPEQSPLASYIPINHACDITGVGIVAAMTLTFNGEVLMLIFLQHMHPFIPNKYSIASLTTIKNISQQMG